MATAQTKGGTRGHLYLDEWFEYRKTTDEEVANALGLHRQTVWKWRTEQHRLNPAKIAQLVAVLDCKPRDLWAPPGQIGFDDIMDGATDEMRSMVADIIRRLMSKSD